MKNFGKGVVKCRFLILILAILLLIPSAIGYVKTRVNYDILTYLPSEIDTMVGQDILKEEFGTGAYSMFVCEGLKEKEVSELREKIEDVEYVKSVIWYDSILDISIPMDMLPDEVYDAFNNGDATMMFVLFETGTSEDETMDAIREIRALCSEQCYLGGMSGIVTDTKDLSDVEVPIYVVIAVILALIVLAVTMDSLLIPVIFLIGIGMAIVYNLGSNIFMGQISYVTKALTAVLQLGVTMDYSIFLWHSFKEKYAEMPEDRNGAMAEAITATLKSVVGSSVTTVAGFIALCFMSFTLGLDLGIVMAKGVVIGVICCVTVLPSMILLCYPAIQKTTHRDWIPEVPAFTDFVMKFRKVFVVLLILLIIPAYYAETHINVYYKMDTSLPDYLPSITANAKLEEDFDMGAVHIAMIDSSLSHKTKSQMIEEIQDVDGVSAVIALESFIGAGVPDWMIPDSLTESVKNENWELMLITNQYAVATDEVNAQIEDIQDILAAYDSKAMLIGEAPCTKDLIDITDHDFKVVSAVSILAVFAIIFFVFQSISLPFILILVIEFAIFLNLGIPYLTGTTLPFIASIVIGTIQLGATVDYAILMTSRYELERCHGAGRKEAVYTAHRASVKSVIVSALSFFAATFGVGLYSGIDMISSLCILMARGALISMCTVLLVLPAMLMLFDPLIVRTSLNFRRAKVDPKLK